MSDRTPARSDKNDLRPTDPEEPAVTGADAPPVTSGGYPGDRRDRNLDALLRALQRHLEQKAR